MKNFKICSNNVSYINKDLNIDMYVFNRQMTIAIGKYNINLYK